MSKITIKIKDAQVTISTHGEVSSNREYRSILEEVLKSDDLKDPKIKELYLFNSNEKGKIHKYKVEYLDDSGIANVGPYSFCMSVLDGILSGDIICIEHSFGFYDKFLIFFGLTEEEVKRNVIKYYTGL